MNYNHQMSLIRLRTQVQKWLRKWLQTYSTQLALGLSLLIIATTLSAGVPAYWLTHSQLNQQVALHLRDAQQATLSLLQTEQNNLANIALLFAQRPTLAALLSAPEGATTTERLNQYIAEFKEQIDLDLLVLCTPDGTILAGSLPVTSCPQSEGFLWLAGQPALVTRRPLLAQGDGVSTSTEPSPTEPSPTEQGIIVIGIWLDAPFMTKLATGTGVEQTLLGIGGTRLVSSLDVPGWLGSLAPIPTEIGLSRANPLSSNPMSSNPISTSPTTIQADGHYHFQLVAPLATADHQTVFYSEILLPADELLATSNQVQGILLTSTGVIALLGAALGAWSIRRITSPLASLTTVAEGISQGAFETPIPYLDGPVEVQTLTAALRRSQASIVQALADRATARDRLDNLVQSLVEGVVIIDHEGKITFWNQGAALITGWPAEQAHGRSLDQVLPPVESHQPALLSELPPSGQRRRVAALTSGGKSSVLEVTSVRSTEITATSKERALVLRDVTEEEATHHLRSYFLGNISHEFRTPLSTLNASMELLMNESENETEGENEKESGTTISAAEMRALLKPIHLSLLELQTLIDNLLEGSTIEAGEFRLRKRQMTLNEAITGALTVVQPMFERRRQSVSVTEPASLGEIWGDRARLTQVLINLLANASKYTPMGEAIDVMITLLRSEGIQSGGQQSSEHKDDIYRVMVADRGPGIPEAERGNLFRRFVRLDSSQAGTNDQRADVHGTGIGLHVVKTTIEAHDGRVGIEERPGGGSIFWFEIPRGERAQ